MRPLSAILALLLLAAALLSGGPARAAPQAQAAAQAAVHEPDPSPVAGPAIAQATELRIERVALSFVCADARLDDARFEARYTVRNPTSSEISVAVVFHGNGVEPLRITVDGAAPSAPPDPRELAAVPTIYQNKRNMSLLEGLGRALLLGIGAGVAVDRAAVRLTAGPGTVHELVVSGRTRGEVEYGDREGYEAVVARHLLLGTRPPVVEGYRFEYRLAPDEHWNGDPTVEVRVVHPSGWSLPVVEPAGDWHPRREGASTVLTRTLTPVEAAGLRLHTHAYTPTFRNGGPIAAIGASFGPVRAVRGRIGYEVAAPSWLLYALTVDTDFRRRAILTPLIEAASPTRFLILPSFGLGVGLPVELAPDRRPGVRVQGDLHVYSVGFVTSVDVYPQLGSLPMLVEASVLGQLAL